MYKRSAKSANFLLPDELRHALKKEQARILLETGKKVPLRIIIPEIIAYVLNVKLPEGWNSEPEKIRVDENGNPIPKKKKKKEK